MDALFREEGKPSVIAAPFAPKFSPRRPEGRNTAAKRGQESQKGVKRTQTAVEGGKHGKIWRNLLSMSVERRSISPSREKGIQVAPVVERGKDCSTTSTDHSGKKISWKTGNSFRVDLREWLRKNLRQAHQLARSKKQGFRQEGEQIPVSRTNEPLASSGGSVKAVPRRVGREGRRGGMRALVKSGGGEKEKK